MPTSETCVVKIQRGRFSPGFQVARAWLSAASAIVNLNPHGAVAYIDSAINELQDLKAVIIKAS